MAERWFDLTVDRELTHEELAWLEDVRARVQAEIDQQLLNLLIHGTSHPQAQAQGEANAYGR